MAVGGFSSKYFFISSPAASFSIIPDIVAESIPRVELDYEKSIQYLQRQELKIDSKEKGWQLISYNGHPLGWINALPNRINNYYPKELRILKNSHLT